MLCVAGLGSRENPEDVLAGSRGGRLSLPLGLLSPFMGNAPFTYSAIGQIDAREGRDGEHSF